jgi:aminopeptidase N
VYRVNYYEAAGWVDTVVYDGDGFRPYTNAVYLRGADFLEEVRLRMGDEAFFAFLKDYASQFSGQIATSDDFFALLRQHTDADLGDIIGKYFLKPY